jgi:hypothetical protein
MCGRGEARDHFLVELYVQCGSVVLWKLQQKGISGSVVA